MTEMAMYANNRFRSWGGGDEFQQPLRSRARRFTVRGRHPSVGRHVVRASVDTREQAQVVAREPNQEESEEKMRKYRGVFEDRGSWWIQYWGADGKRHREKAGTLSAAKKLVEMRRTQRLEGKLPKPRSRPATFSELAAVVGKDKSNYRMPQLVAKFGNSPAEEITPAEIKNWLDGQDEWSLATKNRFIALMKLTYRLAEEAQRIKYNPARLVRQAKENNARIRWLTDAEEAKLRSVIPAEHLAEFEIAVNTGMRRSEQYKKAIWENVDFANGLLKIPKSKHGEVRWVSLNSRVQAVFAILKPAPAVGRIMTLKSPRGWFEKAVKDSGIAHFNWHDLRHTFISRLVMAGVDLRTVQELAGHKTIQMTMRYAHLAHSHVAMAVEKLCERTATSTATDASETHREKASVVQ
jgi:site-specific recombinase XerD